MKIEISLVVPCYRVDGKIGESIEDKLKVLDLLKCDYEMIVVLDGHQPEALKELKKLKARNPHICIIELPQNQGKGVAVRKGMAKASGKYIGYMDVDNDIDPEIIISMYKTIKHKDCDGVLPSKRHPKSKVNYPNNRKVFSYLYNLYVRKFLGWDISDTQLGAKLYKAELIHTILDKCHIKGFVFELEMLALAQAYGFKRFIEIPVALRLQTKTTISRKNTWNILSETLRFSWDYKFKRIYDKNGFKTNHS